MRRKYKMIESEGASSRGEEKSDCEAGQISKRFPLYESMSSSLVFFTVASLLFLTETDFQPLSTRIKRLW